MAEPLGMSSAILTLCQAASIVSHKPSSLREPTLNMHTKTVREIQKLCKYYHEGTKILRRLLRDLEWSEAVCDDITELLEDPTVKSALCESILRLSHQIIEDYTSDLSDVRHLISKLQESAGTGQVRLAKDLRLHESELKEIHDDVIGYNRALNTLLGLVSS